MPFYAENPFNSLFIQSVKTLHTACACFSSEGEPLAAHYPDHYPDHYVPPWNVEAIRQPVIDCERPECTYKNGFYTFFCTAHNQIMGYLFIESSLPETRVVMIGQQMTAFLSIKLLETQNRTRNRKSSDLSHR